MGDPFDLSGRIAIVTGGSRGLGRQMAQAFAERGADVVIASRKLEACQSAAAEIADTTGRTVVGLECHVGHWDQVTEFVGEVYSRFGRVDVLVNNAGMSPLYPSLVEITEALWDKVFDVNVKGPFRMAALIGERMQRAGSGSIINVSSTASVLPTPLEAPYGAAKAGVNNITVSLAKSLGPEVRVNCIIPGAFRTDISDHWDWDSMQRMFDTLPLQRVGEPNEIIGAALYLASDASSYTTGSMLKVDGGFTKIAGTG